MRVPRRSIAMSRARLAPGWSACARPRNSRPSIPGRRRSAAQQGHLVALATKLLKGTEAGLGRVGRHDLVVRAEAPLQGGLERGPRVGISVDHEEHGQEGSLAG